MATLIGVGWPCSLCKTSCWATRPPRRGVRRPGARTAKLHSFLRGCRAQTFQGPFLHYQQFAGGSVGFTNTITGTADKIHCQCSCSDESQCHRSQPAQLPFGDGPALFLFFKKKILFCWFQNNARRTDNGCDTAKQKHFEVPLISWAKLSTYTDGILNVQLVFTQFKTKSLVCSHSKGAQVPGPGKAFAGDLKEQLPVRVDNVGLL